VSRPSIFKNSSWNLLAYGTGMLVVLLATPFYIRFLGLEQFGVFTILLAVTTPLGVLNAGMAQATTKYVAEFHAVGDTRRTVSVVGMTYFLNLSLGLLGFLALVAGAQYAATRVFKIAPGLVGEAVFALRLTGAVWCCNQLSATFQAVITALQDYRTLALGSVFRLVVLYGGGCVLLAFSPHLSSLLVFNLSLAVLFILLWFWLARRALPGLKPLPRWDGPSWRLCYRFSGWQALDQFLGIWANQADVFLLGSLTSASLVGIYGVASSAQGRLVGAVWSALNSLFPATSALSCSPGAAEKMILRLGWNFAMAAGWIYGMAFIYAPSLLPLWVGHDVGSRAAPVLQILLVAALVGLPSALLCQYMLGHGLTRLIFQMSVATSIITAMSSFVFIRRFGLSGAAWGALLGLVLTRPPFLWWVLRTHFRPFLPLRDCLILLFGPQASTLMAVCLGLLVHQLAIASAGKVLGLAVSLIVVPPLVAVAMLLSEWRLMKLPAEVLAPARNRLRRLIPSC